MILDNSRLRLRIQACDNGSLRNLLKIATLSCYIVTLLQIISKLMVIYKKLGTEKQDKQSEEDAI
jgi:hypothetical protein